MKIKDLFSEARKHGSGRIGASGGAKRYQTDQMVDVTMQKHLYDRELAKIKSQIPREPDTPSDLHNIVIYDILVPIKDAEHWEKTRDVNWAIERAKEKKWKVGRLPEEIREKVYKDPRWEDVILDIWKVAGYFLKLEDKAPPPKWYRSSDEVKLKRSGKPSYQSLSRAQASGINDPELGPQQLVRRLNIIAKEVAEQNGYDLTGRRLPPRAW